MNSYLPLPDPKDLPSEIRDALGPMPLNVFRMAAHAPASFMALAALARSILFESGFDPVKREIAVLRVARVSGAAYMWIHHARLSRLYGVTEEQIEKIWTEDPVVSLEEEDNLICRVADEISRDVRLSDEALALILGRYGERGATELILCVSYFNMLSRFLESTRVPVEDESFLKGMYGA